MVMFSPRSLQIGSLTGARDYETACHEARMMRGHGGDRVVDDIDAAMDVGNSDYYCNRATVVAKDGEWCFNAPIEVPTMPEEEALDPQLDPPFDFGALATAASAGDGDPAGTALSTHAGAGSGNGTDDGYGGTSLASHADAGNCSDSGYTGADPTGTSLASHAGAGNSSDYDSAVAAQIGTKRGRDLMSDSVHGQMNNRTVTAPLGGAGTTASALADLGSADRAADDAMNFAAHGCASTANGDADADQRSTADVQFTTQAEPPPPSAYVADMASEGEGDYEDEDGDGEGEDY